MADENQITPEERYRYIGFEVFGGKPPGFWRDETERKSYIQRVKDEVGTIYRNSVVYSSVITATDRIFITIASVVLVIAPLLPWMKVQTLYGSKTFLGLIGIFGMGGFWFYVQKMGGLIIPLSVFLLTALALASIVFGVLSLAAIYRKAASEEAYLARLKSILRLQLYPFVAFLLLVLLGVIGQRIPFGNSLGISGLGGRYTIVTFVQFSSVGLWLSVFAFLVNFNKSKDL